MLEKSMKLPRYTTRLAVAKALSRELGREVTVDMLLGYERAHGFEFTADDGADYYSRMQSILSKASASGVELLSKRRNNEMVMRHSSHYDARIAALRAEHEALQKQAEAEREATQRETDWWTEKYEAALPKVIRWCEFVGTRLDYGASPAEFIAACQIAGQLDPEGQDAFHFCSAGAGTFARKMSKYQLHEPVQGFSEATAILMKRAMPYGASPEARDLIEKFAGASDLKKAVLSDSATPLSKRSPAAIGDTRDLLEKATDMGGLLWRELRIERNGVMLSGIERLQSLAGWRDGSAGGEYTITYAMRPVKASQVDWTGFDSALLAHGLASLAGNVRRAN